MATAVSKPGTAKQVRSGKKSASSSSRNTNKTVATKASVARFIASVENATRRDDARVLTRMMEEVTGEKPTLWGPAIIGFGSVHYRYESGREGDILRMGFSPRKANLALYIKHDKGLLAKLGKHKVSVACLYINKLADVNLDVLRALIRNSWEKSSASKTAVC